MVHHLHEDGVPRTTPRRESTIMVAMRHRQDEAVRLRKLQQQQFALEEAQGLEMKF